MDGRYTLNWTNMKNIWLRAGIVMHVTEDELEKLLSGDQSTANKIVSEKRFDLSGEAYIPDEVTEELGKNVETPYFEF